MIAPDGFLNAYWKRPYAYLDPKVRAAVSPFWALDDPTTGLAKLKDDLDSGVWEERYASLLECDSRDFGYRLITANLA